jgi:glyoxylase-like metal-dependent hydrolase (beta-lactamase superfamily II)
MKGFALLLLVFAIYPSHESMAKAQTAQGEVSIVPAPLPPSTIGPSIDPAKGYFMQELGDGLFFVTDGVYQCMFLTTGEGVILVDAPPSIGPNIMKAIRQVTTERVTHIVYSHAHADHIGSASLFPGALIIAQKEAASQVVRAHDPHRPVPQVVFETEYDVRVGRQHLELRYFGPNHAAGNIFIYAPRQKVLMLVDVLFPGWSMFESFAFTGVTDLPGWLEAQERAMAFDFKFFVSGHVNRVGTRSDLETQREYVADIRQNAASALLATDLNAIIQKTGTQNSWAFFSTFLNAASQQCADTTLAKWKGRLGAVDIFTFSHCKVMLEALRLNDGFGVDTQTLSVDPD